MDTYPPIALRLIQLCRSLEAAHNGEEILAISDCRYRYAAGIGIASWVAIGV